MRDIVPIAEGNYYHIYNRGIAGEVIFREHKNYIYFLRKYQEYVGDVADTLAYCLLRNHFHILLFVKRDVFVKAPGQHTGARLDFSKQFGHFLNGYAQAFNRMYERKGRLFESPFRRKLIEEDLYLGSVMFYIHANPQYHKLVRDFRDWPFSSYAPLAHDKPTLVNAAWTDDWFGGKENFVRFHNANYQIVDRKSWVLEMD